MPLRSILLLALSIGAAASSGTVLPFVTALSAWGFGWLAQRDRRWAVPCLVLNFGMLFWCKGQLLTGTLTALPLGISFYTFQAMGYVLDVSRGKYPAQKHPGKVMLYVLWFPQLVQGPIGRYDRLEGDLFAGMLPDRQQRRTCLQRILWGAFKKLVIADRAAPAVAILRSGNLGGNGTIALSILYCIRIYGDFTGGIDMALGVSGLCGVPLPENFARPFLAESFAEYWRRWHITLGQWMKDYIFYPLSVCAPMRRFGRMARRRLHSRKLPVYLASCITWLATGIWHGLTPNFPLWGLLNFGIITLEQALPRPKSRSVRILGTFMLMNLVRICDLYPNVREYGRALAAIVTDFRYTLPVSQLGLSIGDWGVLLLGFPLCLYLDRDRRKLPDWALCALAVSILLLGCYGMGYRGESFIYGGF